MNGWVKIYRALLDKPIWMKSTPEQKTILITLLLMVNHSGYNWDWQGAKFKVNPGQVVTSIDGIIKKSGKGVTKQNVRSALARFKKLKFLTYVSTKTGRLITILNWDNYQYKNNVPNIEANRHLTDTQPTGDKKLTPIEEEYKNDNNEIILYLNEKSEKNFKTGTKSIQKLINERLAEGFTIDDFKAVINNKVKSWKGKSWMDKDGKVQDGNYLLRPGTLFCAKHFDDYLNEPHQKTADEITKEYINKD